MVFTVRLILGLTLSLTACVATFASPWQTSRYSRSLLEKVDTLPNTTSSTNISQSLEKIEDETSNKVIKDVKLEPKTVINSTKNDTNGNRPAVTREAVKDTTTKTETRESTVTPIAIKKYTVKNEKKEEQPKKEPGKGDDHASSSGAEIQTTKRTDNGRKLNFDAEYSSPNNVYQPSASPEGHRHTGIEKHFGMTPFDFNSDLTTPKDDFFDSKFRQVKDGVSKGLEKMESYFKHNYGPEPDMKMREEEYVDRPQRNDTDMDFKRFRHLELSESKTKNRIHKDYMSEKGVRLDSVSSYNETKLFDDKLSDGVNKIPVTGEGADFKIMVPEKQIDLDNQESKKSHDIEVFEIESPVSPVKLTTEKPVLLTVKNETEVLTNKLEPEVARTTLTMTPSPILDPMTAERDYSKSSKENTITVMKRGSSGTVKVMPSILEGYNKNVETTTEQLETQTAGVSRVTNKHKINLTSAEELQPNEVLPKIYDAIKPTTSSIKLSLLKSVPTTETSVNDFSFSTPETTTDASSSSTTGDNESSTIFNDVTTTEVSTQDTTLTDIDITTDVLSSTMDYTPATDGTTIMEITTTSEAMTTTEDTEISTTTASLLGDSSNILDTTTNDVTKFFPVTNEDGHIYGTDFTLYEVTEPVPPSSNDPITLSSGNTKNNTDTTPSNDTKNDIVTFLLNKTTTSQPQVVSYNKSTTRESISTGTTSRPEDVPQNGNTPDLNSVHGSSSKTTTQNLITTDLNNFSTGYTPNHPNEVNNSFIENDIIKQNEINTKEITSSVLIKTTSTTTTTEEPVNEIIKDNGTNVHEIDDDADSTEEEYGDLTNKKSNQHIGENGPEADLETDLDHITVKYDKTKTTRTTGSTTTTTTTTSPVSTGISAVSVTIDLLEYETETTTLGDNLGLADPNDGDGGGQIAAIVISSVGAVCLLLLAGLLIIMRKRQKRFNYGRRCRPVSLDAYSVDNVSVCNTMRRKGVLRTSIKSYGNPAFEDPTSTSHPLNFSGLIKFANNLGEIREEFEDIPQVTTRTNELPEGCEGKNRYANIIPLPETRVFLKTIDGYPNSDYINANYVTGFNNVSGYYIACQAPLQNTIEDFWRMIWEQQSKVVLMLTNLFENGIEKCVDYLPPSEIVDCHRLFGDFQVTLKKREVKEKYVISCLQLKNMVSNSWREVTHLWYLEWPEKGVPDEANSLIAFLIEARSYMKSTNATDNRAKEVTNGSIGNGSTNPEVSPVVVHCSPGTGRTGTVIACDIAIREFELSRHVDIPKIVYKIRRDRASAVQTKDQYAFIYKAINVYATKLTGGALDSF